MKYLITAKIEVLQIAAVEAESEADALFWAYRDYEADRSGRSRWHWSHAESFDPPSFMVELCDDEPSNDDDEQIFDEDEEE